MNAPVLPLPRDDGYWLVDRGAVRFVPFERPSAKVFPFPTPRPEGSK